MKEIIRSLAQEVGFQLCGFSSASLGTKDKQNINRWVEDKLFGQMAWFPKNHHIRENFYDLGFVPKSVISLGILYNPKEYNEIFAKFGFHFSRYAVGLDYHEVIRKKINPILNYLKINYPENHFRAATDTLPIAEKALAKNSGIGWQGKNTNLINEYYGSYFFLGEILTDLPILPDKATVDRCGKCTKCIDACPTNALLDPYKIDAGLCISHATIEDRNPYVSVPLNGWIYGCDICQEVCPWNVKAEKKGRFSEISEFAVLEQFKKLDEELFLKLDEESFGKYFRDSAVKRISYKQFRRNVEEYIQTKSNQQ